MSEAVKICVYKYKNIPHYEWETELIEKNDDFVLVYGAPKREFIHHTKNFSLLVEEPEIVFFPLNNWFTVCIQNNRNKGYKYYCNICEPPVLSNNAISFVDYDLDIVNNGTSWETVDMDDFIVNSAKLCYPNKIIETVYKKERELRNIIIEKIFPFDGWLLRYADKYLH